MPNSTLSKIKKGNLRIENLVKKFGDTVAVDDVSLEVEHGEFFTLLGPSGSGKTTILMMIAGFQIPSKGMVYIADEPVLTKPPHKRGIGIVFQNYALFPHKTVFANIAYPLKMRKINKKEIKGKVNAILELVQLPGFGNRYPKQLSGGQQQRVAMGRALVFDPAVLLMDEPLGALDKKLRDHMQIELKDLVSKLNITVIYVTHDQQEALTMSDKIAVLNYGKIEQFGTPDSIYENPANYFIADFIGESNLIEGTIDKFDGEMWTIIADKDLEFQVKTLKEIPPNRHVRCAIRPEKIFFAKKGENFVNSCECVIEEIIYIGDIFKYIVRLANQENHITINQQIRSGVTKYRKGDRVRVGWYSEDVKIV